MRICAFWWTIPVEHMFLNGKFLGYKKLNSGNYWVWYLDNRNHLMEHFARFG